MIFCIKVCCTSIGIKRLDNIASDATLTATVAFLPACSLFMLHNGHYMNITRSNIILNKLHMYLNPTLVIFSFSISYFVHIIHNIDMKRPIHAYTHIHIHVCGDSRQPTASQFIPSSFS